MTVSSELRSENLGGTRQSVLDQLVLRRDSLSGEKENQEKSYSEQTIDLTRRVALLRVEGSHLTREIDLQRARLLLANKGLERNRLMRAQDLIALPKLEQSEQEALDIATRVQTLQRQRATLQNETQTAEASLQQVSFRRQTQLGEIQRTRASVEQDIAETESRREALIVAPRDGVVSGIQPELGASVNTNTPLFNIVPVGSKLEAHIYAPSRVIGFLQRGQPVLLRYQSFPFQKFGSHSGKVADVSRSALSPAELNQPLSGLSSLSGTNEPVYRITVSLDEQAVLAYGETIPLKPGMQFDADILIESRRLIEWILDPLYTITGR